MNPRPQPPGPLEHDEDGDPLPQPAPNSDLADLIALAEWARGKDFLLTGPIRVGKIVIQGFQDLRVLRKLGVDRPRATEPEPSLGQMVGVEEYNPGAD